MDNESADNIHPSARIDPSAKVDPSATIGPEVEIGPNSIIGARTTLGRGTTVGADATVEADVALGNCQIGDNSIVRSYCNLAGAVIGNRCEIGKGSAEVREEHIRAGRTGMRGAGVEAVDDVRIDDDTIVAAGMELRDGARIGANVKLLSQGKMGVDAQIGDHVEIGQCLDDRADLRDLARIDPNCSLGKVTLLSIGEDTHLHTGVHASGTIDIGHDCVIEKDVSMRDVRVQPHERVPAGGRIEEYCPTSIDHGENLSAGRIHPSAIIEPGVVMGTGVQVGAGSTIRTGAVIGMNAEIRENAVVDKNATIKDKAVVLDGTLVTEGQDVASGEVWNGHGGAARQTRLEDGLPEVDITVRLHPTARVDPSAKIGPGTSIGPNTTIGPDCVIGAHSKVEYSTLGAGVDVGSKTLVSGATIEDRAEIATRCTVAGAYVGSEATIGLSSEPTDSPYHCVGNTRVEGDKMMMREVDRTLVPPTPDEAGIVIGRGASIPGQATVTAISVIADGQHIRNEVYPRSVVINDDAPRASATADGVEEARRAYVGKVNPPSPPRSRTAVDKPAVIAKLMSEMYGHKEGRGWSWPSHHNGTSAPEARLNDPDRRVEGVEGAQARESTFGDSKQLARRFGQLLEHGEAGCQQPNQGIDLLPRHAETGQSFPIDQQIALDIAEYDAGHQGREYKAPTSKELMEAPASTSWGDKHYQNGVINVPGKTPDGPVVQVTVAARADVMADPKRVLEMRQHNDAGTEPAQRRMDAHRAIARAIKRSGIEFDMTTDGGGVEFDPAKETIRVPKTVLSRNQGERAMQGAYYAAKACLMKGNDAGSHQVDLAATVGATLIAHRMAAKAGREWIGPEEPAALKEAGRLLQRQPQRLQEIVEKTRLVEGKLTPGNPDWKLPDIDERIDDHVRGQLRTAEKSGNQNARKGVEQLAAALEPEPHQPPENQAMAKRWQVAIRHELAISLPERSDHQQRPTQPPTAHEHVPARPATQAQEANPAERGHQR